MKVKINQSNVRYLGRMIQDETYLYLNYSCSGIEFEFTGRKLDAMIWSDEQGEGFEGWALVLVDDAPYKRFKLSKGVVSYPLYEGTGETVTIRLMKLSEAAFGKMGLAYLEMDEPGQIRPTLPKTRKIEFIGDSITCGYGIEGVWNVDPFRTDQENPWSGYAAQVARYFDADFECVSWSGIGVISSWTEEDKPNNEWLMPMIYPYTDLGIEKTLEHTTYEKWQPQNFRADLVVINLGTNDMSYTKEIPSRISEFGKAYYGLIDQVVRNYPYAHIICVLGAMGDGIYPEIEKQVTCYREEHPDVQIHALRFAVQEEKDGIGADWHPSLRTHCRMADTLVEAIKAWGIY